MRIALTYFVMQALGVLVSLLLKLAIICSPHAFRLMTGDTVVVLSSTETHGSSTSLRLGFTVGGSFFQHGPRPSRVNTIASHLAPLSRSQRPTGPSPGLQQRCTAKPIWKEASPSRGPVGMVTPVFVNGGFFYSPGRRFPTVSWSKRKLSDFSQRDR